MFLLSCSLVDRRMTSPYLTPEDIRKDKTRFIELKENFSKLQENLAQLEKLDDKKRSEALLHKIRDNPQSRSDFFELDSE